MSTRHARAASVLLAAAQDLLAAADDAQCDCSSVERESGHRVQCWMPVLHAAVVKATRLPGAGSGIIIGSPQVEKLVANFNALPPGLKPYILRAVKEIRKYAALGPMEDLSKLHAWEREFYSVIQKHTLEERARVASLHDLEE